GPVPRGGSLPQPGFDPENRSGWDSVGPERPHAHDFEDELQRRLGITRPSSLSIDNIAIYARGRAWRHLPKEKDQMEDENSQLEAQPIDPPQASFPPWINQS
ncbi:hypothetical protein, partial [Nonomuraea sp. bgisy094]